MRCADRELRLFAQPDRRAAAKEAFQPNGDKLTWRKRLDSGRHRRQPRLQWRAVVFCAARLREARDVSATKQKIALVHSKASRASLTSSHAKMAGSSA